MPYLIFIVLLLSACTPSKHIAAQQLNEQAEKMLLYQRNNGGWPQYRGNATDYRKPLTEATRAQLLADKDRRDATIDDKSTTLEINYLVAAYDSTQNTTYLQAAERGIAYLLEAQNAAGGWPQFFPDTSRYHKHITYNDNAMVEVLWVMKRAAERSDAYRHIRAELSTQAQAAVARGIQCILRTQVVQQGAKTAWCAQHDSQTLLPANARKFEPASLSGSETVGIVYFLMAIDNPTPEVKAAIRAATQWLESVKIENWNVKFIDAPDQPTGKDRVIYEDTESSIWARFYELDTFRPIFADREGITHYDLREVDNERRVGYGFYGKWPNKLLKKDYPAWEARWGN